MFYLAPIPKQFVDSSGVPYSDGTVEVFLHNDTQRGEIYLDAEGTALAPNPAKLDSHGAWIGYVPADVEYDYIIKDKNGNVVFSFSNVVAVGGGKASSEVDNRLWGHWQNESSWTQTPEVDAWYQTGNFLKAEGDLGGLPGPLWVPITLPAGLYNFSLEIAFLGDSSGGYEKFDLKISYGGQSLRAMSFTFNNSYGSGVLSTEWASGDFALQSDGELKFEVAHKNLNGSPNPSVKISHVFLHKVTAKGSGGGGSYEAGEGIEINDDKISLAYLEVDNQGRVCISYEE